MYVVKRLLFQLFFSILEFDQYIQKLIMYITEYLLDGIDTSESFRDIQDESF